MPKAQFDDIVQQNIETIARIEQAQHDSRSNSDVVADAVSRFCGSITFVWVHIIWYGTWLTVNGTSLLPPAVRFDPPPFPMLTLVVSLEAIFLSTFILISQNRQQKMADMRNHLDLQINLLAEQESSLVITMIQKIMEKLDVETTGEEEEALRQSIDPSALAGQIVQSMAGTDGTGVTP